MELKKKLTLEQFVTALLKEKYEEYSAAIDEENRIAKFYDQYKNIENVERHLKNDFDDFKKMAGYTTVVVKPKRKALNLTDYELEYEQLEGIENRQYYDYYAIKKALKDQGVK